MTITYSVDHLPSSTESVTVEVAPKSELTLQSSDTDPKTGEVTATYVLSSGDIRFPAYVVYRVTPQNRASGSVLRISMTFSTWAVMSDSVSGIDTRKPITSTISMILPADISVSTANVDKLLGEIFSLMYSSVSSGTRTTTWLQKLLYGAPAVS